MDIQPPNSNPKHIRMSDSTIFNSSYITMSKNLVAKIDSIIGSTDASGSMTAAILNRQSPTSATNWLEGLQYLKNNLSSSISKDINEYVYDLIIPFKSGWSTWSDSEIVSNLLFIRAALKVQINIYNNSLGLEPDRPTITSYIQNVWIQSECGLAWDIARYQNGDLLTSDLEESDYARKVFEKCINDLKSTIQSWKSNPPNTQWPLQGDLDWLSTFLTITSTGNFADWPPVTSDDWLKAVSYILHDYDNINTYLDRIKEDIINPDV